MKLERYNQIVSAVILSIALIGALIIVFMMGYEYFLAGKVSPGIPVNIVEKKQGKFPKQYLISCDVVLIPDSEYQLIPIARISDEEATGEDRYWSSYDNIGRSSTLSCGLYEHGTMVNVIVRNKKTRKERLLLDRLGVVEEVLLPQKDKKGNYTFLSSGLLYWEIRDADTNGDGFISNQDALRAYLGQDSGTKLTPLTPRNSQVLTSVYDLERKTLILRYREDSNEDDHFTAEDQVKIIELDPKKVKSKETLIGKDTRQKLRKLYEK